MSLSKPEESVMTPWAVKGKINYMAQITQFGTTAITGALAKRWERVTKRKMHRFIRRGIVFSHQDIERILDCVEKGIPIYIYTGRGPSSESMHLGHMVPFVLTKYLQDALNCIVVIQMSDDEKFLFKDGSKPADLEYYHGLSRKNARDIIACGFDPTRTLIFSNLESNKDMLYFNNILIMNSTSMNQIKGTYGLGETLPPKVIEVLQTKLVEAKAEAFTIEQTIEANEERLIPGNSTDTGEVLQSKLSDLNILIRDLEASVKKFSSESGSSASVGQCVWPAFQCGPAFPTSFTDVFSRSIKTALQKADLPQNIVTSLKRVLNQLLNIGSDKVQTCEMMCLVPMAIDQAPYFRMARDVASNLKCLEPAVIHSEFLPGLKQSAGKMSSTSTSTADNSSSTLFLDMKPDEVAKTIKRNAFSGGRDNLEEHRKMGGDIKIDICYQYLTYFVEDDDELSKIAEAYSNGDMTSGQIKEMTANLVASVIRDHQTRKAEVTDAVVSEFFDWTRVLDIGGCYNRPDLAELESTDYTKYGIDFDRTFGFVPKGDRS